MLARLAERLAAREEEQVRIGGRHHHFLPVHFLLQDFRETDLRRNAERFAESTAAQIAIDQQSARAGKAIVIARLEEIVDLPSFGTELVMSIVFGRGPSYGMKKIEERILRYDSAKTCRASSG